ncbi:hypothetical protein SEVIR_8G044400v4 [Setaria viridis]|uniref:HTH OST-type domain-containing protein n=1 Tax=Setaria viridis TaxID=4556 RepID=A0A4U6TDA1_SETVI|nr:uncharacterized protein LOC117833653 [Setaria viridis]TKV99451.1 hypothetical protein SEVIR_8G044400v2 [Setaria viridis]
MFPSRVRLLRGVESTNRGVLPRCLAPHASSPWHGGTAQRHYHHHHQLQQEDEWDESKAVKVTVWWDFQRCRLPSRADPRCLVPRLTAALRRAGIRGPVNVTAFGDVTLIPRAEREALTDTGVSLSHVPYSGKDSLYQSFMPDLVSWIAQNPPPAHFLLISGDEDFAKVLHRLRMSNYNVLLSSPNDGSKMMRSAATFMWPWEPLVNGVGLVPKYLNQPPDGLSSWYGQYRGCGDDLLLEPKKPMALQRKTKEPKVPKSVVIGIKQVLQFYPEGVSVSNLQAQLKRINVFIDEGFFGFRRFSVLLKAMPDVVKFIDPLPGDTEPAVVEVFKSSVESSEQSSFNRMDSAQSSIEEKHHNESESEELSSVDDQPSSSELPSCTEKKTLVTEVLLSPLEQVSRGHKKAGLTQRAERPSNHVEADVTLAGDVPSPPSDAPSIDQRNAAVVDLVKKTEQPVNRMEADKVDASGTPSSSGAQGSISNKRGLFERISSLWNGQSA